MDATKTVGASFVTTGPCNFVLTPTDLHDPPAAGAPPTISIVTPAGCNVVAMSFQPWVSVTAITPGAGTTPNESAAGQGGVQRNFARHPPSS